MWALGVFILFLLHPFSLAIDEISSRESPCFNIPKSRMVDPDDKWFSSVKRWYYPLSSRLDLYRSVHDVLGTDYKNIPEYSVYYDSCLELDFNGKGFTFHGYNGKSRFLGITPSPTGLSEFEFNSEWSEGMHGRGFTTLTDNKTFVFTAGCFSDNQMTWNVFSAVKQLPRATRQKIFEHVKYLGMNQDYFAELRYDSCKGNHEDADSSKHGNHHSTPLNSSPGNHHSTPLNSSPGNHHSTSLNSSPGNRHGKEDSLACNVCKKTCPGLFGKSGSKH